MKRIFSIFICLMVLVGSLPILAGCGGSSEKIDPKRTQLYVSNYNGGFGTEWLTQLKDRFEDDYKDISYESGKKGVQIMPNPQKSDGISLYSSIGVSSDEVFFNEKIYYNDFLDKNYLLPITDVVEGSMAEFGESRTIEDKLTKEQQDFLKVDGEYYAIPHYEGYSGFMYDVDLFEDAPYYFLAKDKNNGNDGWIYSLSDERSLGPDGEPYTYDDGLPATYDEFFKLVRRLVDNSIIPIGWSGVNQHYVNLLAAALHADYEGLEQMMLNYTFSGTAKNLINVNNSGNVTRLGDTLISLEDGNKVFMQAGRYYALKFIEEMVSDQSYYSPGSFSSSKGHLDAQEDFLYGKFSPRIDQIAMHIDGIWWENEADAIFEDMVKDYRDNASKYNRRFALLPLPKSGAEGQSQRTTLLNHTHAYGFIRSSIAPHKIKLAKDFLRYANSDASLKAFIIETNTPKAMKISYSNFSTQEKEKMTYFGRSLMEMRENSDVVYPLAQNDMFIKNQQDFTLHTKLWIATGSKVYPTRELLATNSSRVSAEKYFNDIIANWSDSTWLDKVSAL